MGEGNIRMDGYLYGAHTVLFVARESRFNISVEVEDGWTPVPLQLAHKKSLQLLGEGAFFGELSREKAALSFLTHCVYCTLSYKMLARPFTNKCSQIVFVIVKQRLVTVSPEELLQGGEEDKRGHLVP